jgi:hypothetical protein
MKPLGLPPLPHSFATTACETFILAATVSGSGIARDVKARGRFHRSFEELRLEDLALVRQASTPDLLRDFGRWQDVAWRRDTLALQ